MKKIIKRFWGVGLIVIILSSLLMVAAPVSAADPLRWESKSGGPSTKDNAISPGTTVYDFAVSPDAATIYAACGTKLFQSIDGGSKWTDITNRLSTPNPTAVSDNINFVAIASDAPNIVVVADATSEAALDAGVAISVDSGVTFTDMVLPSGATTVLKGLEISALVSGGYRYVSVFGSNSATGNATLWYFNYGAGVGGWRDALVDFTTKPADKALFDHVSALQFSPNFASDYMAMALVDTAGVSGNMSLHALSFNISGTFKGGWDTTVAAGYPINVVSAGDATFAINKASIALAPDFMGGDETLRIAFVGADLTSGVSTVASGIWRCNDVAAARNIYSGVGFNSLAYDGTNLVAGAYTTNNVYHCSDPLDNSPTVTGARSLKRIGVDQDSFNDQVQVMFVGDKLFGAKRGLGGAISKSLDYGVTWNDYTLINQKLDNYDDILPSADGSVWYVAIRGSLLSSIYRMSPMQRVLCVADSGNTTDFMLHGIDSDANVVYAADKDNATIYYSADGGVSRWQQRTNVPNNIADLAVESQNVIYFGYGSSVYKSINNGFTWNSPVNSLVSGNIFNLISIGENKLVASSSSGSVVYSTDGGATWTKTGPGLTSKPMYIAASGLAAGDYIFAAPNDTNDVYRCILGPSNPPLEFKDMNVASTSAGLNRGVALKSGVLYAVSVIDNYPTSNVTYLNSTLVPTIAGTHTPESWRTEFCSSDYNTTGLVLGRLPSALKVSTATGKIVLWAVSTLANSNSARYFDDTLAAVGPTLTGPANKSIIQTNSVTGYPMSLNLMWSRPSLATGYTVEIALDSSFVSKIGLPNSGNFSSSDTSLAMVLSGSSAFNPGSTYYWRVRAYLPITSAWSETRSITMQPLAAAVPGISSPANGSTIKSVTPAFSWTPVTSCTKYEFQLSVGPVFATSIFSDTPASAGSVLPDTTKLEKGKQYFWRVRALEPVAGDWSTIANFTVAMDETTVPPVTITSVPAPTFTIPAAPAPTTVTLTPAPVEEIAPTYIWAIIIIGAILVIAVIVLIVRTRRSV